LIGYYNYSVIATYIGLISGITGIRFALTGHIKAALICLLISGLCDMMDGAIARKCKRSDEAKCFGMELDSLCDLVCFGVFPAMIGYVIGPQNIFTLIAMIIFIMAAVIRLGYFNVQEILKEPDAGKRTHYTGLPVTAAAIVMPAFALLHAIPFVKTLYVYPLSMLLVSFLFVSRLKVKKPYGKALGVMALIGVGILVLVILFGGEISGGN